MRRDINQPNCFLSLPLLPGSRLPIDMKVTCEFLYRMKAEAQGLVIWHLLMLERLYLEFVDFNSGSFSPSLVPTLSCAIHLSLLQSPTGMISQVTYGIECDLLNTHVVYFQFHDYYIIKPGYHPCGHLIRCRLVSTDKHPLYFPWENPFLKLC